MPPLPVITNVFRCALNWEASGQHAVNVIHVAPVSPPVDATDVFDTLDRQVQTGLWTLASTGASIVSVDITPLDGSSATQSFPTGSPSKWSGGLAGDWIPAAAVMIKLQTTLRGRSNRGRIFLPFTAESGQADGVISGASVTGLSTQWGLFLGRLTTDPTTPLELGVASYVNADFHVVSNLSAESALGTQRRRQGRLR